MEMDLLEPLKDFRIETYEEFQNRYKGFGKEIYKKIKDKTPNIFNKFEFYKRINFQIDDSYAICKNDEFSFGIQLESEGEIIVLWNGIKQIEIGFWADNEYEEAINFIKSELLK